MTIRPEALAALGGLDTASVYNVLKGIGRAEPEAWSGPELRCLFPLSGTVAGVAITSSWTAGEPDAPNADYLAFLEAIEAAGVPVVAILADVGRRPGRSGIAGDGMLREAQVAGAVAAVVGGSVVDVAGIERLGLPVYATGVVPAYDDLRMGGWGDPVTVGSLQIATGDVLVADRAGIVRVPPDALEAVVAGAPGYLELERSMQAMLATPGLTVAGMRAWYAANEPEFLGGDGEGSAATTLRRSVAGGDAMKDGR